MCYLKWARAPPLEPFCLVIKSLKYFLFRSEMGKNQKLCHFLKQIGFYLLLPLIFLITTFLPCLEKNELFQNILMQSHVPVNRKETLTLKKNKKCGYFGSTFNAFINIKI